MCYEFIDEVIFSEVLGVVLLGGCISCSIFVFFQLMGYGSLLFFCCFCRVKCCVICFVNFIVLVSCGSMQELDMLVGLCRSFVFQSCFSFNVKFYDSFDLNCDSWDFVVVIISIFIFFVNILDES